MTVEVSSAVLARMVALAAAADPDECCGILLGEEGRITALLPAANVHPDRASHFEIDPQALVNAHRDARHGGPRVVGYYHSHPNGLAAPSPTDRAQAAHDGRIWAIIATGQVTLWRDTPAGFAALSYAVA